MDAETFVRWVLDDSRNLEELYTTELVVEQALGTWKARNGIHGIESFEQRMEKQRQRKLNPAYRPTFTEENLRRAAEMLPSQKYIHWYPGYDERQIRDLTVLKFLPALESFSLSNSEVTDLNPLTELPALKTLTFGGLICEDFTPLGRCGHLLDLKLDFAVHWPELSGLEKLVQLTSCTLKGNLLAFPGRLTLPNVRVGTLDCTPLAARSVRDLPQLPNCEILTIAGVERLDGIEAFPHVLNLTLNGKVREFGPLEALKEMTCFTCNAAEPLDVSPLTRLPKLYLASFTTKHEYGIDKAKPRDFSSLVEAPQLREVQTKGCAPVETEVSALNTGLLPWNDLFLAPEPRPIPQLKVIVAPMAKINQRFSRNVKTENPKGYDVGLRTRESEWAAKFVAREINRKIGAKDWGKVEGNAEYRSINVTVESFSVVEKVGVILETTRGALAWLRSEYNANIWVNLKAPKRKRTKAEKQLEEKFEREQEDAEFERRQQEEQEYLDRLHRYELKKQEGSKVKPEEFAAPAAKPLPPAPWEKEEEEDEEGGNGNFVVKTKKPEPPPSYFDDDDHPLADNYRAMGWLSLSEVWFTNRDQGLVSYLIGRAPDEVIPEDKPAE